jgi:hypothetical protein
VFTTKDEKFGLIDNMAKFSLVAFFTQVSKPARVFYTYCPKAIWFGSHWFNTRYLSQLESLKELSITQLNKKINNIIMPWLFHLMGIIVNFEVLNHVYWN